jgi:hypothetical protein
MKSSSAVLVSVTVLCQNDRRRVHALDTIYKCNISVSSLPAEVDVAIGVGDVAAGDKNMRMRVAILSASIATPIGSLNLAKVAGPPPPLKADDPSSDREMMIAVLFVTMRIRLSTAM